MRRPFREIAGDRSGAIAPVIALSLFGLLAVGGIAFDYARMATLDSELQSAADQAALAAASQLDGQANACSRAAAAARNMVTNQSRMVRGSTQLTIANEPACDGTGNVRFFQDLAKTTAATSDANAKFVEVQVDPREAFFALTPVVGLLRSGSLTGIAYAGIDSAICKTPPVMICNPQETATSTAFDLDALKGKGMKLVSVGSNGSWAPGNFGYLDTGSTTNGANGLREDLGWQTAPGDCISATGVDTKPGATVSVVEALNTRFDIYDGNTSCLSGGSCGASINSVKDVGLNGTPNGTGNNYCNYSTNSNNSENWHVPDNNAYGWGTIPTSSTTPLSTTDPQPSVMGHPPDMCHAVPGGNSCTNGRIGDGAWDVDTYFRVNYGWTHSDWTTNTGATGGAPVLEYGGIGGRPRRYDVYKWEIAHRNQVIATKTILGPRTLTGFGNSPNEYRTYGQPICSPLKGYGSGVNPSASTPDRRVFSVAIVNCLANNVTGNSTAVPVKEWIDIFLVQPAINRSNVTNNGEIYVEVVGRSLNATDEGAVQLVKKSVPYLIE